MIRRDEFGAVQMRGHRHGGTLPVRERERHFLVGGLMVAAAVFAAYSAYSSSEAQAQQAHAMKNSMKLAEASEEAAGTARANQIDYEAKRKQKSFLSRAASAGISVDSPSLLETETEFASDTSYAKQLAKYPHQLAGFSDKYQADLFGFSESRAHRNAGINAGVAFGSTLATGAARAYGGGGYGSTLSPYSMGPV